MADVTLRSWRKNGSNLANWYLTTKGDTKSDPKHGYSEVNCSEFLQACFTESMLRIVAQGSKSEKLKMFPYRDFVWAWHPKWNGLLERPTMSPNPPFSAIPTALLCTFPDPVWYNIFWKTAAKRDFQCCGDGRVCISELPTFSSSSPSNGCYSLLFRGTVALLIHSYLPLPNNTSETVLYYLSIASWHLPESDWCHRSPRCSISMQEVTSLDSPTSPFLQTWRQTMLKHHISIAEFPPVEQRNEGRCTQEDERHWFILNAKKDGRPFGEKRV